jgi:hypothetical protein
MLSKSLRKNLALRRKQNYTCMFGKVFALTGTGQCLDTGKNRFRFQHHSVATAEWPIINDVMLIAGPLPQIVRIYLNQTGFSRTSNNSVIDNITKELGKNRDDIDA